MNSRSGTPLKIGTIPMDLAVHGHKTEASGVCMQSPIWNLLMYSLIQYKSYNSKLKNFDGVQFRKYVISLPAFYLIIWLMKLPKNFEKTSILKIWQLDFFCGIKTGFGEKQAYYVIEILIDGSKEGL